MRVIIGVCDCGKTQIVAFLERRKNMRKTVICSIVLLLFSYCVSTNADYTFDTPINLESAVNSSAIDATFSVSSEGLSLFFSDRSDRYGSYDL